MQATALTTTNSELAIPAVSGKGLDWFTDGYEVVTDEWVAIAASGSNVVVVFEGVNKGKRERGARTLVAEVLAEARIGS